MNEEEIKKLVKVGYLLNFNSNYIFKVKGVIERKIYNYSAIFINRENREVTFEGGYDFREELLNELLTIIGGVKNVRKQTDTMRKNYNLY